MIGFKQDYLGQVLNRLEFSPRVVLENCDGIWEEETKNEFQNTMKRMGMKCEEIIVGPGSIILTRANQIESVKMTNITTLKLELIDDYSYYRDASHQLSSPSIPNMSGFVKHFPQVRMIEISKLLFTQKDKSVRRRHVLEFKSKLPGVRLYVT